MSNEAEADVSDGTVKIIGASDPRVMVPFEVPIAGRRPMKFSVPRLQFLPLPVMEEFDKWLEERDKVAKETPDLAKGFKRVDECMKLLELLLPTEKYQHLEGLTVGEKLQIDSAWRERSQADLPKSEASPAS